MNSPRKWDEALEAEFFTPEEIEESDRRVAEIQCEIEAQQSDRAKVIKRLERCVLPHSRGCTPECEYHGRIECCRQVMRNALALLKAQQQTTDTISREDLLRELRKIPGYRDEESEALVPLRDVCKIVMLAAAQTQIVRCRNCEHGENTGIEWRCNKHSHSRNDNALGEDRHYIEYHHGDWFCADGERRR